MTSWPWWLEPFRLPIGIVFVAAVVYVAMIRRVG